MPSEDSEKLLRDAERMVKEMERRSFTPQKTAARKENDEAKKCKTPSEFHLLKSVVLLQPNRPAPFASAGARQG